MSHVPGGSRHWTRACSAAFLHGGSERRDDGGNGKPSLAESSRRRAGISAREPSAGLPCLRQRRRVPASRSDDGFRSRREPLRGAETTLRQAHTDQLAGLSGSGTLHPLRPLHPLRLGSGRRPAHSLHGQRQHHPGQHLPRCAVQLVFQRQHRADMPCRSSHCFALSLQGSSLGFGRVGLYFPQSDGRPHRGGVFSRPDLALSGDGLRRGELGLAERPRPLQFSSGQPSRSAVGTAHARRCRQSCSCRLERGIGCCRRNGRCCGGDFRAAVGGCDRRGASYLRSAIRLGEAGEGSVGHRQC